MTEPRRPTPKAGLLETLTDYAPLAPEIRRAPRHRQQEKTKSSALGLLVAAFAMGGFIFCGWLATRPTYDKWVLGGAVVVSAVLLAFGALVADRETVWPVLVGLLKLFTRGRKALKE